MATISTKDYLLDQAKRRFTPTPNTIPGMGFVEKRLMEHEWEQFALAEPPAGSGLTPVMGDSGLPIIGHMIEFFRGGPDFALRGVPQVRPDPLPAHTRAFFGAGAGSRRRRRQSSPTATRSSHSAPGIRSSGRSSSAA